MEGTSLWGGLSGKRGHGWSTSCTCIPVQAAAHPVETGIVCSALQRTPGMGHADTQQECTKSSQLLATLGALFPRCRVITLYNKPSGIIKILVHPLRKPNFEEKSVRRSVAALYKGWEISSRVTWTIVRFCIVRYFHRWHQCCFEAYLTHALQHEPRLPTIFPSQYLFSFTSFFLKGKRSGSSPNVSQ